MAIIKHRAIHTTPRAHLKYILNPGKNEDMKYSTAICCTNNYQAVCEDFREIYEAFAGNKFDNYQKSKKEHVRIHSYIQSFDESVSPELAHQIGVEWAKAMFGENRPVIISTHNNTGHCHNHFEVCPYDLFGNRWLANKATYQLARDVSDRICKEHGLKIIENPKKHNSIKYKEWDARKKGYSWKIKMADVIDKLIIREDVTDISLLVEKMKERGYIFTNEKRLIAKPKWAKYGCSIAKLGYGYSEEMLRQRIANKQYEFAGRKISALVGIQVELAVTIREKQIELYRSQSGTEFAYTQLKRNAELLCYLSENHIHSLDEMKAVAAKVEKKSDKLADKYFYLEKEKNLLKLLNNYGDEYDSLLRISDKNEIQKKRFDELYQKFVCAGFIGYDIGSPDWLSTVKNKIRKELEENKNLTAEMKKAGDEHYRAGTYLQDLEKILETDFERICKREKLCGQIKIAIIICEKNSHSAGYSNSNFFKSSAAAIFFCCYFFKAAKLG